MRRHIITVTVLSLLCLLLTSCGLKNTTPVVKNDATIADKYTEETFLPEDMALSAEDFIFFKIGGFLEDYSPEENRLVCLSPASSVTYSETGMEDNGFALSTSRMIAPGDSDIDDFYSAYKIANECALICREDADSATSNGYVPAGSDDTEGFKTRVTIGAYAAGESWATLDTAAIAALLDCETQDTPKVSLNGDSRLLLISAYADANENITQLRVYCGTAAILGNLRSETGLAELNTFIEQAQDDALLSDETTDQTGTTETTTDETTTDDATSGEPDTQVTTAPATIASV